MYFFFFNLRSWKSLEDVVFLYVYGITTYFKEKEPFMKIYLNWIIEWNIWVDQREFKNYIVLIIDKIYEMDNYKILDLVTIYEVKNYKTLILVTFYWKKERICCFVFYLHSKKRKQIDKKIVYELET